ncbi:MAG: DUF1385 domain-containing protein [Firmicutes bacterium]|nr:DUF1385 domain-containing protein [Bacillota bacterium]
MKDEKKQQHITSIGGQAVMEGVMMRGPHNTATAVRRPDGEIEVKVEETGTKKHGKFARLPIVRGCVNFIDSLVIGMKSLMWSAEFVDIEADEGEEESKLDKWLENKFGDKLKDVIITISVVIAVIFSVAIFMVLPWLLSLALDLITDSNLIITAAEGVLRMAIFIGYLAIISKMKDIQRVYEYHGAEHKTIACYEAGEELTPENVKKYTRFHPRCGTSFLLIVMVISILIFFLIPPFTFVENIVLRKLLALAVRLCLLPIVAGISYEAIKLAGRSTNKCVKWLTKPGLWMQRLTTREPDESQIEVAIASMKPCIPDDKEDDKW